MSPMKIPGIRIPRLKVGICRWNRSPYQASVTISASLPSSDGWKLTGPKLNQRRAPLALKPISVFPNMRN